MKTTNTTINALQSQMEDIISQFGQDACFAHADKVYSQSFRSEPMRICDMLNDDDLNQEQYYKEFNSIVDELWEGIASELYTKCTGKAMPEADMDYDDNYCDMAEFELMGWIYDRNEWVRSQGLIASEFIKETTEIVLLCNYKGEEEGGLVVFNEESRKLPVFKSKRESFMI